MKHEEIIEIWQMSLFTIIAISAVVALMLVLFKGVILCQKAVL